VRLRSRKRQRAAECGITVSGVEGHQLGIDVRPADGKLYGVCADGRLTTKLTDVVSAPTVIAGHIAWI